jgi:hypothetical protein
MIIFFELSSYSSELVLAKYQLVFQSSYIRPSFSSHFWSWYRVELKMSPSWVPHKSRAFLLPERGIFQLLAICCVGYTRIVSLPFLLGNGTQSLGNLDNISRNRNEHLDLGGELVRLCHNQVSDIIIFWKMWASLFYFWKWVIKFLQDN